MCCWRCCTGWSRCATPQPTVQHGSGAEKTCGRGSEYQQKTTDQSQIFFNVYEAQESIPQALRAGTITLSYSAPSPHRMFKNTSSVNNKRTLEYREKRIKGEYSTGRLCSLLGWFMQAPWGTVVYTEEPQLSHIHSDTPIRSQLQSRFSAGSGSRVLMTQNWKMLRLKNILIVDQKLQFIISRRPWRTSKVQEKPSASKENIQHFKTWNFFTFSIFVGQFYPRGSGSSRPKSMRIHADLDPQSMFRLLPLRRLRPEFYMCKPNNMTKSTKSIDYSLHISMCW